MGFEPPRNGKTALITGVTGQDGAYLADFLLAKGYVVHGVQRSASSPNGARLARLGPDPRFVLHNGDLMDATSLMRIVAACRPDEVYNLAAQSHVQVSFETPEYNANADALGPLRLLEAIRLMGLERRTRFCQASTSELFGHARTTPQTETTPFQPRNPYGAAKLYAHWIVVNFRESYGLHASNGILYNHESPLRGETFVLRKITRAAAAISLGRQKTLHLGNLDASRDWGDAREYVRGLWLMLQQDQPDDYVFATGAATKVRAFVEWAFEDIGRRIEWRGEGLAERGLDAATGEPLVEVDPRYFRPAEVDRLIGDAAKARVRLGWRHTATLRDLAREMVREDLARLGAG